MKIAKEVISKYLQTNSTHAYGKMCETKHKLTIHIRSGDTVRGGYSKRGDFQPGSVHWKYAPVPTSFYGEVLKKQLEKSSCTSITRMLVVSQDVKNPTTEFFLKLQNIGHDITFRIGKKIAGDLHALTCSSEVAIAYGSFWNAFALRDSTRLHIFTDSCIQRNKFFPSSSIFYTFFEGEGKEYIKGTKIWKNTAYQRHLVDKYYKITKCS